MTTPGKPRQSGIPTPGRPTGISTAIPTPGRPRSTSSAAQHAASNTDVEYMSRAFADAIKANDPAHHRASDVSAASLSPQSASLAPQSGRRSVAGRPSSVASSSSSAVSQSRHPERVKTPISARPPSRHSDVFGRSASRAGKMFEVGDNVRIESLGYEGKLKYIGEIEGKPGLWAGVELSGGFANKGKNNGTVNGKQYFSCPANCGVFVATTKLSAPTVGPGAVRRPSSVTSSRGGRITPSISGRITPSASTSLPSGRATPLTSISNGRTTPVSTGWVTPGATPVSRTRIRALSKPISATNPDSSSLADKITAGSRASKYVSMTAKQLSSRDTETSSPTRSNPSPAQASPFKTSPVRSTGSSLHTPKPGLSGRATNVSGIPATTPSKSRASLSTPRPRIPSAIAMPPPASPSASSSSRSVSLNDPALHHERSDIRSSTSDLEHHGKALQDKIAQLMSGGTSAADSPRPGSATSFRSSTADDRIHSDQLQTRIDALEYENDRLRSTSNASSNPGQQLRIDALQLERDEAVRRISDLENELKRAEGSLNDRDSRLHTLDQDRQQAFAALESEKRESETRFKVIEAKLADSAILVKTLKENLKTKESAEVESDASLKAKNAHIASLESRLDKAHSELEDEKKELGGQVDELRQAGQETIALYEERLSAADSERYELENRIALLEARIARGLRTPSPTSTSQPASATLIDNETLRDQVHHLQKKIATMEDIIEDARATSEKEEAVFRERMKRLKDKEEAMKRELNEGRNEVERMFKSEANARSRVEEIEEALRESTVALENARAEVESLRAELANLDGLVASSSAGDLSARVAEVAQRAATDRTRFEAETARLEQLLVESRANERRVTEKLKQGKYESQADTTSLRDLQEALSDLQTKNDRLLLIKEEQEEKLITLRQTLTDRTTELDSLKKKINRDVQVHGEPSKPTVQSPPSSKHELAAAREEITGLKHIVQELQKENLAAAQRGKLLESENQLLLTEAEQLRQEVKIFEDNLDQSLNREEQALDDYSANESGDIESLRRTLREQKLRFETEFEQLRKRLADAEMKNARTTHDLNKEISELEALVESKIYREDELEQEIERLKDRLARQKKSSKNGVEAAEQRPRVSTASVSTSSGEDVCEICERPGHDIFNCDLLKEDMNAITKHQAVDTKVSLDLFCEDCESHGHLAADCPHSLEVF